MGRWGPGRGTGYGRSFFHLGVENLLHTGSRPSPHLPPLLDPDPRAYSVDAHNASVLFRQLNLSPTSCLFRPKIWASCIALLAFVASKRSWDYRYSFFARASTKEKWHLTAVLFNHLQLRAWPSHYHLPIFRVDPQLRRYTSKLLSR